MGFFQLIWTLEIIGIWDLKTEYITDIFQEKDQAELDELPFMKVGSLQMGLDLTDWVSKEATAWDVYAFKN